MFRRLLRKACERLVLAAFARARTGRLQLTLPDGRTEVFGPGGEPSARMQIRDARLFPRLVFRGDIGLGEGWEAGEWTSPDLLAALTWLIRNRSQLESRLRILRLGRPAHSRNTRARAKENVRRHYDLGNAFFKLFLDDSMTYSSARFAGPKEEPLEQAQARKIDLVLDKARVGPEARVLEIGSGWGSLALRAARIVGVHVESLTLSDEQLKLARERAHDEGLDDAVSFELRDYRDARGTFDAVVSVEMLEAVGHRFYGAFFHAIDQVLKPGGRAVVQTILIADAHYSVYKRGTDWIQKRIFPGGIVPSLSALTDAMKKSSRLALQGLETFGEDYARTLALWRQRFDARLDDARALGCDDRFIRSWQYYLAACEAGFREKDLTVAQLVLARPAEFPAS